MNCSFDFLHHVYREGGTMIDFHTHASYEVIYYVHGSGRTQIGRMNYEYGPGTFAIVTPQTKHDEHRTSDTEVLFACFSYDNAPFTLVNGLYSDEDGELKKLLRGMKETMGSMECYAGITLTGLLYQAIAQMARTMTQDIRQPVSDKVIYAKNYMEQYASEAIDLQAIASDLGYSYDYFRHFFKSETGYSPMQFLIRKRVEKAKQLLLQTSKSMTEIADNCGFSNSPQFSTLFSKHTGSSPSDYRRNSHIV